MKKIFFKRLIAFTVIMCLMCVLSIFCTVSADEYSGRCDESFTWRIKDDTLTISGTGKFYLGYKTQAPWNSYMYGVTKLVFDNGITEIGNCSIQGSDIKEIYIPKSVIYIDPHAFEYTRNLESIIVDSSNAVYTSVDGVLYNSDKTELVLCPEKKADPTFVVPDGVKTIKAGAFFEHYRLESISLPEGLETIEDESFTWCQSLKTIEFPSTLKAIGEYTFEGCFELAEVNIPANVNSIGGWAFASCYQITKFTIDSKNTTFCVADDILFTKDKTKLVAYPAGKTDESYSVPDTVKIIGDGAFSNVSALKTIDLPNGVTTIGSAAFEYCYALSGIDIPASVTEVGWRAFSGCYQNASINVDSKNANYCSVDGVLFNIDKTELIRYPAANTNSEYVIPHTVKTICDDAFSGAYNLETIDIPNSVTSIAAYSFNECRALASIEIPASVTEINDGIFSGCTILTSITLPNTIKKIGSYVFDACMALTDVYFDGTPVEWEAIPKGADNFLIAATLHFKGDDPAITRLYVNPWGYEGITVEVSFANVPEGAVGYVVAYDENGKMTECHLYNGEPILFTDYYSSKFSAYLWDSETFKPLAPQKVMDLRNIM